MPSFLNDENSPIFANHDIVDLDPTKRFALAEDKVAYSNAGVIRNQRSDALNETFDESSAASTQESDLSDTTPMALNGNSNGTRPTSLSSLPNGRSATASAPEGLPKEGYFGDNGDQPLSNGTTTTLLSDRTVGPRLSDVETNGSDVTPRNSTASHLKDTTTSPMSRTDHDRNGKVSFDGSAQGPSTPPDSQARNSKSQLSSIMPISPSTDPTTPQRMSPHRLSSPPVYQSSHNSNAANAGHLQPMATPVLKQRHTLEVPKLAQSRLAKEGTTDVASASGRFSPTTAGHPTHRRASINLARRATRSMQSDAPRDEVVPDEDAARWAEAYRQKRASKRRRKEEEDDDRVLVGTKVDESHANWVTAYNMLTGIRVSVSRTNAKLDRELTGADFGAKQKSTFDM